MNRKKFERYSRMVSTSEIADPANDYNLNIPRYIDNSEPEDLHDLDAHINGGIPDTLILMLLNLIGKYFLRFAKNFSKQTADRAIVIHKWKRNT